MTQSFDLIDKYIKSKKIDFIKQLRLLSNKGAPQNSFCYS